MVALAAASMTATTTASVTTAAMAAPAEMRRGHAGCVEVRSRELGVREMRHTRRGKMRACHMAELPRRREMPGLSKSRHGRGALARC
jgi:hypothetical protein